MDIVKQCKDNVAKSILEFELTNYDLPDPSEGHFDPEYIKAQEKLEPNSKAQKANNNLANPFEE